jgi:hypothetical protein
MKKKILMFAVMFLASAMLAGPVMAIGPWQALEVGNNPNLFVPEDYTSDTDLRVRSPSGTINYWAADVSNHLFDHQLWIDASKANIGNAVVLPDFDPTSNPFTQLLVQIFVDPEISLEYEHKWLYLSFHNVVSLLVILGMSMEDAIADATIHNPQGAYYMYMNVGN